MERGFRERFTDLWQRYFGGAGLPIGFYYTDEEDVAARVKPCAGHRCVLADINRVVSGRSLMFDSETVGCFGGKKYLGFSEGYMPGFEYFLSTGIPGEMEGERYKKSPELVQEYMERMPSHTAPGRYIVFKRWDRLADGEDPDVVVFFSPPDVVSGLFTLANYDEPDLDHVFTPFGAGCAVTVMYPYLESLKVKPRCVLGMFDVSGRPCVRPEALTFAVPMKKFITMVSNMEESFLALKSWNVVKKRIAAGLKKGK